MACDDWNNLLPEDLLIDVVLRLNFEEDYYRFFAVCKTWNSAAEAAYDEKPWWLPRTTPMLFLAEEVAPGSILYDTELDLNKDYGDTDEEGGSEDPDDATPCIGIYDYLKNSVGTSRGLYSLSSMKTYNIELPEAAGKQILGTSKGWLLTIGRDLQINLLHPLSRYQFSLPSMLTFPLPPHCHDLEDLDADYSERFIQKVAMSSRLLKEKTDVSFFRHHATPSPIVMTIYGEAGLNLAFARLGDKVWTAVQVADSYAIDDIVYHKGKFYAVNVPGDVFMCCIDSDEEKGGPRGTKIASIGNGISETKYLVEPLSGSGLLLIVRYVKKKFFGEGDGIVAKYRTTKFAVWRLDLNYSDSLEIPSCTLTEEKNLGNEAIFVGRASSFSVSSSEVIKPNSIYFTDDDWEGYAWTGGGHDMGIFDMEHGTIEPHFKGKSLHCICPPLWYI